MLLRKNSEHVQTVMLASGGEPVTGVVHEDVRCYVSKNGGAPAAFVLNATNFKEIDSTMMPGLYAVTFEGSVADTVGELVAVYKDNTGSDLFDQYATKCTVYERLFDDIHGDVTDTKDSLTGTLDQITGNIASDKADILAAVASSEGEVTSAIGAVESKTDALETAIGTLSAEVALIDTATLAVLLTELKQEFDTRVPEEAALKRHLVSQGGIEEAPLGKGIWDVLGDGTYSLADLRGAIERLLGLSHENFTITDQEYNNKHQMVAATITLYPSASDVGTRTNAFATYRIRTEYDADDRPSYYEMKRES